MLGVGSSQLILSPAAPEQGQQSPTPLLLSETRPEKITKDSRKVASLAAEVLRGHDSGTDSTSIEPRSPEAGPSNLVGQPRSRPARSMYSQDKRTDEARGQRRGSRQLNRITKALARYAETKAESAPSDDTRTTEAQTRWSQVQHPDRRFLIAETIIEFDQISEGASHD